MTAFRRAGPPALTPQFAVLGTTLFLLATANLRFYGQSLEAFPPTAGNLPFLASLPIVLGCVIVLLLAPLVGRWTLKPALMVLLLLAAPMAYFSDRFGVVLDRDMIRNVLQTDPAEVAELVTVPLVLRIALLGVLPAVLIARVPIVRTGAGRTLREGLALGGGALVVGIGLVLLLSAHYASFFREHKPLRFWTNPVTPVYALGRFASEAGAGTGLRPLLRRGLDAQQVATGPRRAVLVLVVGETVRADHLRLYGYPRDTTPVLDAEPDLAVYRHTEACGTSTAASLPCMFALEDRADFDPDRREENVLDVLQRAGVTVLWRDNNSGSKGVAARIPHEDFRTPARNPVCDEECRDVGMLAGLSAFLDAHPGDVLIVLHQKGNHGPAYFRRYPADFTIFEPACRSDDLPRCTDAEIVNAYDNALRYTDWFLGQVIAWLRTRSDADAAMLYVSDHGESLGERGLYLHGLPRAFAPDAQLHVPLLLWRGPASRIAAPGPERTDAPTSHDDLSPALLAFFRVRGADLPAGTSLFRMDETP